MTATAYSTTIGTRTSLTSFGATLASANYGATNNLDIHAIVGTATAPNDVIVEIEATSGTVTGNKQLVVFAKITLDGTNLSSGPTSGTTVTDQADLYFIGVVPMGTNATAYRKAFSLLQALGFIPYSFELVVLNDSGVAISAGAAYYTIQYGDGR